MRFLKRVLTVFNKKLISILMVELILLIIVGQIVIEQTSVKGYFQPKQDLKALADDIYNQCQTFKYRPACYEKKIPQLMDAPTSLSMQQAFTVTDFVQQQDSSYGYCHVTGHHLSQKEVQKDPNNWKSVITKCPAAGCANGCIHGVFMQKYNAEYLDDQQLQNVVKDIEGLCEKNDLWNPTNSETFGCYHALGHAVMYVTKADVERSKKFCQDIGTHALPNTDPSFNCMQGLFMQIFQPLEEEDTQLVAQIKPKTADEALNFCKSQERMPQIACLNQSWPLFFKTIKDPTKLNEYCQHFEEANRDSCHLTTINILTSNSSLDSDFMLNYCAKLSTPSPGECLGISASRMFEINLANEQKAFDLCTRGASIDPQGICFSRLASSANYVFREPLKMKPSFCQKFPPEWQQQCLDSF